MANYTPDQIASYLRDERLATHGISPEVHQQNEALLRELGQVAYNCSDALMSVQILGSRADGTSGQDSDLDFIPLTFATDSAAADRQKLFDAVGRAGVVADIKIVAAYAHGVSHVVPTDPESFIAWVDDYTPQASSLFEDGVFTTDNQKLARLAVTTILRSYDTPHTIAEEWDGVRKKHAETYLGDVDRIRTKLIERLGSGQATAIHRAITHELMRQRHARFGLPADMDVYHDELRKWATSNRRALQESQGWELLQGVQRAL